MPPRVRTGTDRRRSLAILTIRPAALADASALAEVAARTFRDTFVPQTRPEDVARFLAERYGVEQQLAEIRDPAMSTLLAAVEGTLSGFVQLKLGLPPECVTGPKPIEIYRLYLDKEWHGRGLAQALMETAGAEARRLGAETLWLGVWERNARALAFYVKCGFVDVGWHLFPVGDDPQIDRILVRSLEPGAIFDEA